MPFNQTGANATANIHGTYNDVAGNQTNTTDNSKRVGSVTGCMFPLCLLKCPPSTELCPPGITATVVSGAVAAGGAGLFGSGTGTANGVSNSGNINI
ncbi:hypothetical protein JVU11DRAFT_8461 [Chiua virens]|nr:hypothetical protein JVU11DRAFT_8461 [Chiua virens]